jgi:hypothetical protein
MVVVIEEGVHPWFPDLALDRHYCWDVQSVLYTEFFIDFIPISPLDAGSLDGIDIATLKTLLI